MVHAVVVLFVLFFFFSSRRRHTRFDCDWSSDVCSSDLPFGNTYTYSGEGRQMVIRDIMWYLQRVQARRRGRYDGAQGVPILDESSTFPPGEFRLKQMTDRALEELARHWAHIDRRLKGRHCGLLRELRRLKVSLTEPEFELRRFKVDHADNMTGIITDRRGKSTNRGTEHDWRVEHL